MANLAEWGWSDQFSLDGRYWVELFVYAEWQSENYTRVSWKMQVVKTSGDGYFSGANPANNFTVWVDGQVAHESGFGYNFQPVGRQTRVYSQSWKDIWHDGAGHKEIHVRADVNLQNSRGLGSASTSANIWLPRIPKPPQPPTITHLSHISASNIRVNGTVPDNMGAGIDAYAFEWATNPSFTGSTATTHNGQILDIHSLAPNTTYWFKMGAHNNRGWSGSSNTVSATTLGHPSAPTGLSVTPSPTATGRVSLAWSAPSVTGQGGIVGYNIFRDGVQIATTTGTATGYTDNSRTPYTSYSYAVAARNSYSNSVGGTSAWSSAVTAVAPGPPSAPRSVIATADGAVPGKVDLSWTAPLNTGAGGITGYDVRYAGGALIAATTGTGTTYSVTGLNPGSTYSFQVFARNALSDAEGSRSAGSNTPTVTPIGEPSAPTGVSVVRSPTVSNRLVLTWTPPAGSLSGYSIFRRVNNADTLLAKINASHTAFTIDGLTAGSSYTYVVRARTAYTDTLDDGYPGNWGGPASAAVTAIPSNDSEQPVASYPGAVSGTNAVFAGTYTISAVSSNTVSYPKINANIPTAASGGSILNNTNTTFNGSYTISSSPTPSQITYARTASNVPSLSVFAGTVTNTTNVSFNGNNMAVTAVNSGAHTVSYTKAGPEKATVIVPVNAPPGKSGVVSNLTNAAFNVTGKIIKSATANTLSYDQTGTNVPLNNAAGTVTNRTNTNVYNGSRAVVTTPSFDSFTYTVPANTETSGTRTWIEPRGKVERETSTAKLEVSYRSGWIG